MPQLDCIDIESPAPHAAPALARPTRILSGRDVADTMRPADYLEAVALGFRAAAEGRAEAPPPLAVGGLRGSFHAKAAALHLDRLYVALKFNGNFPGNPERHGLPTIQGALLLSDGETGALLAVIDSAEITLRRTAAATALAARHLARPASRTLLVCGCGAQGAAHVAALREVLPLALCLAWDRDPARAAALASQLAATGLKARVALDLGAAARRSDVIACCTTASEPYLQAGFVVPGTFVAAVGADNPDKSEIDPALFPRATVVVDVLAQCLAMGDLHHAVRGGVFDPGQIHAELQEIVTGATPGRTRDDEITLFDSTGTALSDVACAVTMFERAIAAGTGLPILLGTTKEEFA